MDAPGVLGIGYYDSLVDPGSESGGSFLVARVPIELDSPLADAD
jgi:hypothetical protein